MLTAKSKIGKVVIIRPGALGDVLAVRSVIRFLKDSFPGVNVTLIAPGERGRFLARDGWADRAFDYDRSAFAWLYTDGADDPPAPLAAAFAGSDVILAYQDFSDPAGQARFEARLDRLAPAAGKVYCPSRPTGHHREPIGEWLLNAATGFCRAYGLLSPYDFHGKNWADVKLCMDQPQAFPGLEQPYVVMHPGSGSGRKNWPVERFAALARLLLETEGSRAFRRLLVTSGEADSDLGERLVEAVPGALLLAGADLTCVAGVLAYARLYVGNDSGVSHLAGAVTTPTGGGPTVATLFGPSDAVVWSPPGALILDAGEDMRGIEADAAFRGISARIASESP
ncbi:MAG: glycosyltransferase family 9 protein [Planctomycetaceae bacterium]|nr:glycosyltransferase family 9 protein [Planctomycetaceae bacterium]